MGFITHFSVSIYYFIRLALYLTSNKSLWIKNLLAEICHFNTQKYKKLLAKQDQAGSYIYSKLPSSFHNDKHLNKGG